MGWDAKFHAKKDWLEPNTRIVTGLGECLSGYVVVISISAFSDVF